MDKPTKEYLSDEMKKALSSELTCLNLSAMWRRMATKMKNRRLAIERARKNPGLFRVKSN